jgi:molybdenum cofactor cytidylyltransferase
MPGSLRVAVLILAGGAGRRFSSQPGAKLLADLDGQPLLSHVLETARAFGPAATVVVLGHGAAEVEGALRWHDELRVRNRAPERGLASSIQAGMLALEALPAPLDGAFIVLGDQPGLRSDVIEALADAAEARVDRRRLIVVPRYASDAGPRNPVLILRAGWPLVDGLAGDHGLAPIIEARPDLVLDVPVDGSMPDVDEPADLERLRRIEL